MNENEKIINFCGEYPSDFVQKNIINNPNFVFENDPNYTVKKLYDPEDNVVLVNSFEECAHYVSGGWDGISTGIKNEIFLQKSLLLFSVLAILTGYIFLTKKLTIRVSTKN
tara:strand:+ start:73 stop:405 length:333 start_codon:yes stop_codon:yes gene_type:complete